MRKLGISLYISGTAFTLINVYAPDEIDINGATDPAEVDDPVAIDRFAELDDPTTVDSSVNMDAPAEATQLILGFFHQRFTLFTGLKCMSFQITISRKRLPALVTRMHLLLCNN